jgi:hypothetical protein
MNSSTITKENENAVLNVTVDNKLLQKLKEKFTEEEQQLFVQSFCNYLKYDQEKEYIVDLDDVWQWMGFSKKKTAKDLLQKHFTANIDYKISEDSENLTETLLKGKGKQTFDENKEQRGGHNKETILMNIKTFKKLCMKANTKKAGEIHDYYIKMEETLHQYIVESLHQEKKLVKERMLIEHFQNKPINYFGSIGEIDGSQYGKYGYSGDICQRIKDHKKEIGENFILDYVIECERNTKLENAFKKHHEILPRRVTKTINGKVQTELIKLDNTFGAEDVKRILISLKEKISLDRELVKMKHEERMLELNVRLQELEVRKLELTAQQSNPSPIRNVKKICKFDFDMNLLKEYDSISAAARDSGGNRKSISNHCKNGTPYLDCIWKYSE